VAYQDDEDGYTQLIRFSDAEHFEEIKEDLDKLIRLGVLTGMHYYLMVIKVF
jgi:hypothetical protein